ncbi:helix-turn-helix domain-containing protein [uncultured Bacteroides sp.]|uniref:helix-turn-helix domain-containing protein n=1 Tax=uncultured Bacteroides sp. TaxID=162156 RepID=UPI002AA82A42|nr:helix-turn-helix domain-containing protein [uncultured Bacteroides sp.]
MKKTMEAKEIVVESLIHIEWHIDEAINTQELSQAMNCSSRYLNRIFYKVAGISLSKYIRLRILMEAKRRFSFHQSLPEVAQTLKYEPEELLRSFRKEFGDSLFSLKELSLPYPLGRELIRKIMATGETELKNSPC